jgi:hypothetical protein
MVYKSIDSIDVSNAPALLKLIEDVHAAAAPRVLRRGDEPLAMILPLPSRTEAAVKSRRAVVRPPTPAERDIMLSAAGSWHDVDADQLIEQIYAARDAGDRPPVDL